MLVPKVIRIAATTTLVSVFHFTGLLFSDLHWVGEPTHSGAIAKRPFIPHTTVAFALSYIFYMNNS